MKGEGPSQTAGNPRHHTRSDRTKNPSETDINGPDLRPVRARMTHRNDSQDACRLAYRHDPGAHTPQNRAKKAHESLIHSA